MKVDLTFVIRKIKYAPCMLRKILLATFTSIPSNIFLRLTSLVSNFIIATLATSQEAHVDY